MAKALTAAVEQLDITDISDRASILPSPGNQWQADAWNMYDEVGELRFVCQWLRAAATRCTLYAADVDLKTGRPGEPTTDKLAEQIVASIAGGSAGQSELMGQAATALTVPGEFHVAIVEVDGREQWRILPSRDVSRNPQGDVVVKLDGDDHKLDPASESVFRVWSPHPRNRGEADSPVRAALPILREIRAMDKTIAAAATSRLSGNGLLLVPKEIQNAPAIAPAGGDAPGLPKAQLPPTTVAQSLSRTLTESMKQAVSDPSRPEAVTPIVLSVPGEQVDHFKHITFGEELTAQATETRDRAIRRLALSLDVPAEVLLGLGDSTHWNAAMVDEQALRQHVATLMTTICDAFTVAVLQPLLEAAGRDASGIVVWFDMSALQPKEQRAEDAVKAFEAGVISPQALRRELGFSDEDAPAEDLKSLAERMVSRAPSLLPYLSKWLGFGEMTTPDTPPKIEGA